MIREFVITYSTFASTFQYTTSGPSLEAVSQRERDRLIREWGHLLTEFKCSEKTPLDNKIGSW